MSDTPYEKECIFCKNKITMSKETGKWLPYELNTGKAHDCRKASNSKIDEENFAAETAAKQGNGNNNHNEISLEVVLKKLASIGITIDLEKLRNCK